MLEMSNITNTLVQKITFVCNYKYIYFSYELKYDIHTQITNVCNLFGYAKLQNIEFP